MLERKGWRMGSQVLYEPDNLLRITNMGSTINHEKVTKGMLFLCQWDAVSSKIWLASNHMKDPPCRPWALCLPGKGEPSHSEKNFLTRLPFCNEKIFQHFWGREMSPTYTGAQKYDPEGLHGEASRICKFNRMYRFIGAFLWMGSYSSHLILQRSAAKHHWSRTGVGKLSAKVQIINIQCFVGYTFSVTTT